MYTRAELVEVGLAHWRTDQPLKYSAAMQSGAFEGEWSRAAQLTLTEMADDLAAWVQAGGGLGSEPIPAEIARAARVGAAALLDVAPLPGYGANNKVFTKKAADEARRRVRALLRYADDVPGPSPACF